MQNQKSNGRFIISLDYEKYWGVCFLKHINEYSKTNILPVDQIFSKTLKVFSEYEIKATFAIVGFLFLEDREQLNKCGKMDINYKNKELNPYIRIRNGLPNDDSLLFGGKSLLDLQNSPHEVGSHTFSHFYCSQGGQTRDDFKKDLELFDSVNTFFEKPKTLIFPWNDVNEDYFDLIASNGFTHLRVNNENSYIYDFVNNSILKRILRLLDRYLPIAKIQYSKTYKKNNLTLNTHSRFFAPYQNKLWFLEKLRIRKILKEMTVCAQKGKDYHLWWHPHNFGNQEKMFKQLEVILAHYQCLNKKYNFTSVRMDEL